jgi:CheY-like chemotaxis protein
MPEEWGGDTVMVEVSAKTQKNIPRLLEMILLVGDMRELKADPDAPASGTVLESELAPELDRIVRADALRLLSKSDFHGVISDMRTPGGVDGAQVYAWIAAHRPALAGKLVFITGDIANEETAATLRRTGAPCVEKPFRVADFIAVVEQTMGKAA